MDTLMFESSVYRLLECYSCVRFDELRAQLCCCRLAPRCLSNVVTLPTWPCLACLGVQGRGTLKAELQRKESDLGRSLATQDAQAALIDELKAAGEKAAQV